VDLVEPAVEYQLEAIYIVTADLAWHPGKARGGGEPVATMQDGKP
jgi:hypothetical protein